MNTVIILVIIFMSSFLRSDWFSNIVFRLVFVQKFSWKRGISPPYQTPLTSPPPWLRKHSWTLLQVWWFRESSTYICAVIMGSYMFVMCIGLEFNCSYIILYVSEFYTSKHEVKWVGDVATCKCITLQIFRALRPTNTYIHVVTSYQGRSQDFKEGFPPWECPRTPIYAHAYFTNISLSIRHE